MVLVFRLMAILALMVALLYLGIPGVVAGGIFRRQNHLLSFGQALFFVWTRVAISGLDWNADSWSSVLSRLPAPVCLSRVWLCVVCIAKQQWVIRRVTGFEWQQKGIGTDDVTSLLTQY
jgi:hypothetical protein